jgi:hypothetical protein
MIILSDEEAKELGLNEGLLNRFVAKTADKFKTAVEKGRAENEYIANHKEEYKTNLNENSTEVLLKKAKGLYKTIAPEEYIKVREGDTSAFNKAFGEYIDCLKQLKISKSKSDYKNEYQQNIKNAQPAQHAQPEQQSASVETIFNY